jgi:hypothetical protein
MDIEARMVPGEKLLGYLWAEELCFEEKLKDLPGEKLSDEAVIEFAYLILRADVFNVLDSQQPISYVKEDIPVFGQVWARQQPQQARLVAKIKW